jgi:hypothetical protein
MTLKIARKQIRKKCFVVLICLLMFGNLGHGAVLCFGSDGQIEIESAFHERCDDSAHLQPADQKQRSYQSDHTIDENCEPCVDIPIYIGLAKIPRVFKQLNSTFPAPVKNVIVPANKFNLSAYNSASSAFDVTSYFTPLRSVILLI